MQMYLYAGLMQGSDLVEKIKDPSIVHRIGNVQANNM